MEESLILDFLIWKELILLEIDWDLGIEILNRVNRRKNKLQNRKKRVFKKSLGKKRQ